MAYVRPNLVMSSLGATYTDDSPCGSIPAGDPYRSPGHWCMYNGQMLQFDDKGNVHPDPVSPTTTVGPPGSIVDKITSIASPPVLIAGAAAVAAYFILRPTKKRRR